MSEQMMEMEKKMRALENRLNATEKQIEELKRKEKKVVAFSAMIQKGGAYGPFNSEITLAFETVITNIGGGYNNCTGIFVAPVAGIYYFTFFYHAGGEQRTVLLLCKNSYTVVRSSDHRSNCVTAHNGGNAAFLQLNERDQVCVRQAENSHIWASEFHTTFSGYLVHQM